MMLDRRHRPALLRPQAQRCCPETFGRGSCVPGVLCDNCVLTCPGSPAFSAGGRFLRAAPAASQDVQPTFSPDHEPVVWRVTSCQKLDHISLLAAEPLPAVVLEERCTAQEIAIRLQLVEAAANLWRADHRL